MTISAPFRQLLAAGRPGFNARVAEARRRHPGFDSAAFSGFLQTGVDPLVQAIAAAAPDRLASTVFIAYDLALDLVGQGLAGPKARHPGVNRIWEEVIPAYGGLAAVHPAEVIGSLTNAVLNIAKVPGARPEQWIDGMRALGPVLQSPAQLQLAGQVLAWRSGMAHFRHGALQAADGLPQAVALAALGLPAADSWPQVRGRLAADPWWPPSAGDGGSGRAFGSFAGFGGEFTEPPQVRACADGFLVRSGARFGLLTADAFGSVLHAATEAEFEGAAGLRFERIATLKGNSLRLGQRVVDIDLPADRLAVCNNADTAALTSPYTHSIRLFPLR